MFLGHTNSKQAPSILFCANIDFNNQWHVNNSQTASSEVIILIVLRYHQHLQLDDRLDGNSYAKIFTSSTHSTLHFAVELLYFTQSRYPPTMLSKLKIGEKLIMIFPSTCRSNVKLFQCLFELCVAPNWKTFYMPADFLVCWIYGFWPDTHTHPMIYKNEHIDMIMRTTDCHRAIQSLDKIPFILPIFYASSL